MLEEGFLRLTIINVMLVGLVTLVPPAQADTVTFSGSFFGDDSEGNLLDLAASAAFDFSDNALMITLTNTATATAYVPSALLSGVLFSLTPNASLTPVSATLPAGSSIIQGSTCNPGPCTGTDVGGEFSYYFPQVIDGQSYHAIAGNGWIVGSGSSGNFGGPNLDNPDALDGMNFGIVNAGFMPGDSNPKMDKEPLIRNSVVFKLSGVSGLSASSVSSVLFQYGTGLEQPRFVGTRTSVPEPASGVLEIAATALAALLVLRHRLA